MVRGRWYLGAVALALALVFMSAPLVLAEGTGDDPANVPDVLTPAQLEEKEALEQQSTKYISLIIDAPYRYLSTPSIRQERSYWCGPATVQIISGYHGIGGPQSAFAARLGTTPSGTVFSWVDDTLRWYTAKPYYYYGGLTTSSSFYGKVADSIRNHGMPLAADVTISASYWPYYNYDHEGHIVPVEGFDWRNSTVRLNDPYDERYWLPGGGPTFGRTVYGRDIVWRGVASHWRRAVVSAP